MQRLLVAIVSMNMGFTACTGGLFTMPLAVAATVKDPGIHNEVLATPAVHVSTCTSATPATNADTVLEKHGKSGGCSDGKTCLTQNGHAVRENSLNGATSILALEIAHIPSRIFAASTNVDHPKENARDGGSRRTSFDQHLQTIVLRE